MVNKTFCDICFKEIKLRDAYRLDIAAIAINAKPKISIPDMCEECKEKIRLFIESINKNRETTIKFIKSSYRKI